MWPKFPDICLTVEGKPWKNVNQEINPIGIELGPAAYEVMMLPSGRPTVDEVKDNLKKMNKFNFKMT